jgi:hypothetical protein
VAPFGSRLITQRLELLQRMAKRSGFQDVQGYHEVNQTYSVLVLRLLGDSMMDILLTYGTLNLDTLCKFLRKALARLRKLHKLGKVHGNVTPQAI